ncbi:uncharacterized protein JCM6883_000525 [Sporobolomyces salmoneus]|uniref:uncharacterized protein n=1 Tax=Sporobolomyces salmoneus TaxID=183962 RepID=UPI0031705D96
MAGSGPPSMTYNDSMNLPSSPFPFSSFLSDSIFSLEPNVAAPPPPPVAQPHVHHQAGLFVHSKEINPFERSFAVIDSTPIPSTKPFAGGANRHGNGQVDRTELYLSPSPEGRRKRALSSPALFTPGGTGNAIVDEGTAQAFKQAKRPSLRLAPDGKGLSAIPGLARGVVDSSSSLTLSDSTGSSRSLTSVSFDEDPNFRPKILHAHTSTVDSPDSSIGLSPEITKPSADQLRDGFATSSTGPSAPPNFAHFQPQPIPFTVNSIAPNPAPFPIVAARPYSSSSFASTTLAPASIARSVTAPLVNGGTEFSSLNSSLAYTSTAEDTSFPFTDPFALIPQQRPRALYTSLPPSTAPTPDPISIPSPHFAPVASSSTNPPPLVFAAHPSRNSFSQPPTHGTAPFEDETNAKEVAGLKQFGKKRGRKPKNWDPSLEVEVVLDPEEAERQRKIALERNRIAASKSRRRKKEKVQALEGAAREYCESNSVLQSQCQALLAEVHQLRTYLMQAHPQPGCKCQHVHGYFNREREGGGLNAIMFESKGTLDRNFANVPRWGSEEDVYAEYEANGAPQPGGRNGGGSGGGGAGGKPVAANGGTKSKTTAVGKKGAKKQDIESEDDDDDNDEDLDGEESEEEKVALKSRRARAIPIRKS